MFDRVAAGARLAGPVRGKRKRLLTAALMLRAIVLMTLMPDADAREAIVALAGDLAMVPRARDWQSASPQSFGQWRQGIGPGPLEELQDIVLGASREEHEDRDWRAVIIGGLKAASADGTLIRMPDTPANRAAFGSTGTADDSAPFPQLRALMLNDASTRSLPGMPHGPSGGDKAAAELVSNAAVWIAGDLADIGAEPLDHMFAVNLRAPYLLCRAVLPRMAARGFGRVVVVGSVSTRNGGIADSIAYSATKAALPTLVRALARYAGGQDLLVNAVMPSAIETPMTGAPIDAPSTRAMDDVPVGRSSRPGEVANLILWLSSDQCSYVQGAAWDVNGGRYFS